jgi:hypothetical protein
MYNDCKWWSKKGEIVVAVACEILRSHGGEEQDYSNAISIETCDLVPQKIVNSSEATNSAV